MASKEAHLNVSDLPAGTCVLLGTTLTEGPGKTQDSVAHILPSAIGGRLKPKGILSSEANSILEKQVDGPYFAMFGHQIAYLAQLSIDRGAGDQTLLTDPSGKRWVVSHDKPVIEPAKHDLNVTRLADGKLDVAFSGTPQQLYPAVKSIGVSKEEAEQLKSKATVVSQASEELNIGLRSIRSDVISLACWTVVALFAAYKLRIFSVPWRQYVCGEHRSAGLVPHSAFTPSAVKFAGEFGTLAHGVAIWNEPHRRLLLGYVQTFGGMGCMVVFAHNWDRPVRECYCVDPTSGRQGEPSFAVDENSPFFTSLTEEVQKDAQQVYLRLAARIEESG